jgi:hypothetical protein
MTDQEDRERESQQTEDTRYDRELDADATGREAAAELLRDDPPPEPDEG